MALPKIKLTYDRKAFATAICKVVVVTKKAEADVVNKALKDVAFRAASFTPKSSMAKIRASFTKQSLAKYAVRTLKAKGEPVTRKSVKQMMRAIIKRKNSSIGALRAGWIPAIEALGGTYRGAKKKPGGSAAQGKAIRAIPARLQGMIENTIMTTSRDGRHSADEIAVSIAGLERGIEFVRQDREGYAQRKLEQALAKASD